MPDEPILHDEDQEFQLHLYDKLWENIIHKENRLWTFLTVYGTAIGIAIGTGVAKTLRFETGFIILLLTYWAAEIIIDAEWWSVRNRLMVRGIERRAHEAIKGIIPSYYHKPFYAGEALLKISLFVFAVVGVTIFALSIGAFERSWEIESLWEFCRITLLYSMSAFFLIRCMHNHEKRIKDYYSIFKNLNEQERRAGQEGIIPVSLEELNQSEDRDRKGLSWRLQVLCLYLVVTIAIALRYFQTVDLWIFVLFCLIQVALIACFLIQRGRYNRSDEYQLDDKKNRYKQYQKFTDFTCLREK